ncbi:MAG: hypothetical protein A2X25_02160 [Chloroflexi bacterium GWB2_49_20]|nr:MAG: hypothetical protein A2X25_02160 [Chloroflexi bacterium GWB2_49_20]OGN78249.1 MAG: hypothetical protein A2X26_14765 [Chloroflexi bacterium GWC2_49_37]OGN85285.1 MAG: hypothetical protein A2X27_07420 [Chloroflexi bacterium GWD2_49_16]
MNMNQPLIRRFHKIGDPHIKINEFQKEAIRKFKQKISAGTYKLENADCLCGSKKENSILVSNEDRYGLAVNSYLCQRCGLLWTTPRLDSNSLMEFYNSDYRQIYTGRKIATEKFWDDQVSHGEKILKFVKSFLGENFQEMKVLDIGCGAGGTLMPFLNRGFQVFGCDLNDNYLATGRNRGLNLYKGEVKDLLFLNPINLVIASHVLEHLLDPLNDLLVISRLLSKGDFIYIELPGIFQAYEIYGDFLRFLQNAHLYHFTLKSLTRLLAQAGFSLVEGNERICALFVKSDKPILNIKNEIEVKQIVEYIKQSENKLRINKMKKYLKDRFIINSRYSYDDE